MWISWFSKFAFSNLTGTALRPGWVNRFATNADATVTAVTYARDQIRVVGEEIGLAATAVGLYKSNAVDP
jgi:hypothetical protein